MQRRPDAVERRRTRGPAGRAQRHLRGLRSPSLARVELVPPRSPTRPNGEQPAGSRRRGAGRAPRCRLGAGARSPSVEVPADLVLGGHAAHRARPAGRDLARRARTGTRSPTVRRARAVEPESAASRNVSPREVALVVGEQRLGERLERVGALERVAGELERLRGEALRPSRARTAPGVVGRPSSRCDGAPRRRPSSGRARGRRSAVPRAPRVVVREQLGELLAPLARRRPRASARPRRARAARSRRGRRLVGDVARQDVLEDELGLPASDDPSRDRTSSRSSSRRSASSSVAVAVQQSRDRARPEHPPDDGRRLQRPACRPGRAGRCARRARPAPCRGSRRPRCPRVARQRSPSAYDPSVVDQVADDLLQEERVALGALEDPVVHRRRQVVDGRAAAGPGARRPRPRAGRARPTRRCAGRRPTRAAVRQLGPRRDRGTAPGPATRSASSSSRSSSAGSAQWMSSITTTTGRAAGERREERAPRGVHLGPDVPAGRGRERRRRGPRGPTVYASAAGRARPGRPRRRGVSRPRRPTSHLLERRARSGRCRGCPAWRLQDLGERPVRDAVAVREASAAHAPAASASRALGPREELAGEPALPDARARRRS